MKVIVTFKDGLGLYPSQTFGLFLVMIYFRSFLHMSNKRTILHSKQNALGALVVPGAVVGHHCERGTVYLNRSCKNPTKRVGVGLIYRPCYIDNYIFYKSCLEQCVYVLDFLNIVFSNGIVLKPFWERL